ncbi:hypothetical protein SAICODRAFT_30338 [Saitoella complicata NRRL Y-17804]|uniref:uncharacterized protein n=1 Tax=Saitoella complicata (strain BCRC 22490 / CBS 7301 / JCM 7358 / NBRC 10748 / NRRL Y-17804) TaxID=698492 RepID=UPI000867B3E6|nr:uncharacterized protein SAICODRAFT_30338 [Saitoella complicata NRRL Y-17804]ODQ52877.1 hypothetical protein SAICODRAFT_30338 [Saitoella complicata NRRL Y-17804]
MADRLRVEAASLTMYASYYEDLATLVESTPVEAFAASNFISQFRRTQDKLADAMKPRKRKADGEPHAPSAKWTPESTEALKKAIGKHGNESWKEVVTELKGEYTKTQVYEKARRLGLTKPVAKKENDTAEDNGDNEEGSTTGSDSDSESDPDA